MTDFTEFLYLCKICRFQQAEVLLKRNPIYLDSNEPLLHAVLSNNLEQVHFLLKQGFSPNLSNSFGETPLSLAADNSSSTISNLLVQYGADLDSPNINGETPLHHSAFRGNTEIMNTLLSAGANPNVFTEDSRKTPLHFAVTGQMAECARLLLRHSADSATLDADMKTPIDLGLFDLIVGESQLRVEANLDTIPEVRNTEEISENCDECEQWTSVGTVSFISRTGADSLLSELNKLGLSRYYPCFKNNGLEDLEKLLKRMKSKGSLGIRDLQEIGIDQIGFCIVLLMRLDEINGDMHDLNIVPDIQNTEEWNLSCYWNRTENYEFIDGIRIWLELLGLQGREVLFERAGYSTINTLYRQMLSRWPISNELLKEIGICEDSERRVILNKLKSDCKLYIGKNLTQNRENEYISCSCSVL